MQTWLRILRWLTRAGALAALASVIVEFGFGLPEGTLELVHALELAVVGMYAFNAVAHVLGAKERARFLRENWLDAALLCLLATALGLVLIGQSSPLMTRLSFIAAQVLIVARMLVSLARTQERLLSPKMQPAKLLLLSFLFLIARSSEKNHTAGESSAGAYPSGHRPQSDLRQSQLYRQNQRTR
jgi:hypothetical protein